MNPIRGSSVLALALAVAALPLLGCAREPTMAPPPGRTDDSREYQMTDRDWPSASGGDATQGGPPRFDASQPWVPKLRRAIDAMDLRSCSAAPREVTVSLELAPSGDVSLDPYQPVALDGALRNCLAAHVKTMIDYAFGSPVYVRVTLHVGPKQTGDAGAQ